MSSSDTPPKDPPGNRNRRRFLKHGAMLGTVMVASVFFVIVPGQRELVSAKREGRDADPTP